MFLNKSDVLTFLAIITAWIPFGLRADDISRHPIADRLAAEQYCESSPLTRVEGIWEFPEDETFVLIRKKDGEKRKYELILISSPDCRLHPGECIGYLNPTADSDKFKLTLYINRKYGLLSDTRSCSAEYRPKEEAIIIHPRQLKISLRTPWFLPKFWRSLRVKIDDPATNLPKGLRKVFPTTIPENPIYL